MRPGNPPALEKARTLFNEKFFDPNRYRLGRVGRFRINRKLDLGVSEKEMTLRPEDILASMKYLLEQVRVDETDEADFYTEYSPCHTCEPVKAVFRRGIENAQRMQTHKAGGFVGGDLGFEHVYL